MEGKQDGTDSGSLYQARKALFARGIRQGRLTTREIEQAVPAGSLTDSERWLLFYSLRAAQVEIVDESARTSPAVDDRSFLSTEEFHHS